MARIGTI